MGQLKNIGIGTGIIAALAGSAGLAILADREFNRKDPTPIATNTPQTQPSNTPVTTPTNTPSENKPTPENKPAEPTPTPENKPAENKPAEPTPTPENKPAENKPAEPTPVPTEPVPAPKDEVVYRASVEIKTESPTIYAALSSYLNTNVAYRKAAGKKHLQETQEAKAYLAEIIAGEDKTVQENELENAVNELEAQIEALKTKEPGKHDNLKHENFNPHETQTIYKAGIEVTMKKADAEKLDAAFKEYNASNALRTWALRYNSTPAEGKYSMTTEQVEKTVNDVKLIIGGK